MSSALAMILTAATMIPANGPEMVSAEFVQGLDLSGKWEGTLWTKQGEVGRVQIDPKVILIESAGDTVGFSTSNLIDEGDGKLDFKGHLGLYRQADDVLLICVGDAKTRPLSIGKEYGTLFVLRRIKPRK
ncbi:MAG TPA: hypothetical protein VMG10_27975 [Gemmataceae bacterium]|nr:hypothetical protein [Gemmataceae bacterium]